MKSFSITDVGRKRKVNQDYVFKSDGPIGKLPNLYAVADGMGGHQAGDLASKLTVQTICEEIAQSMINSPEKLLKDAIEVANRTILEKAAGNPDLKGMGTTIVAATVVEHTMHFINVGDSRLYVLNEGIRQLSKDHSLVEEMVRLGGIKPEEAKHHPDKNIITRAIGAKEGVDVDYYEHKLKKGDTVLMCSDGLSNLVEDDEIFDIVQGSRDVVEAGLHLIEKANEYGGSDNIAVVLFQPFTGEVSIC